MYKMKVKYEDLDGEEQVEEFMFHYSKQELATMNYNYEGGLQAYILKIQKAESVKDIIALIKDIVLGAYGRKSDDNKTFIKEIDGHKLADDFKQSEAFSEVFMTLASDEKKLEEFINGCLPKSLLKEIEAEKKKLEASGSGSVTPIQ